MVFPPTVIPSAIADVMDEITELKDESLRNNESLIFFSQSDISVSVNASFSSDSKGSYPLEDDALYILSISLINLLYSDKKFLIVS